MPKPDVEYFGKTMSCPKCGRPRGDARLCDGTEPDWLDPTKSRILTCPRVVHLHWRCTCGHRLVTWTKDNAHGPAQWYDKPIGAMDHEAP